MINNSGEDNFLSVWGGSEAAWLRLNSEEWMRASQDYYFALCCLTKIIITEWLNVCNRRRSQPAARCFPRSGSTNQNFSPAIPPQYIHHSAVPGAPISECASSPNWLKHNGRAIELGIEFCVLWCLNNLEALATNSLTSTKLILVITRNLSTCYNISSQATDILWSTFETH